MEKFGSITKKEDVTGTPTQLFRKECHISGQVGNAQQRDPLTYGSLTHQIEAAIRKGYKEIEVVEAVIKAVNPGIPLRSYLKGGQEPHPHQAKGYTQEPLPREGGNGVVPGAFRTCQR